MKNTPFYSVHANTGARIVDFGGYAMPVQYTGIIEEHTRVRTAAGMFDVSHMGELKVFGEGAFDYLQRVTLNDIGRLTEGRAQYSAMLYEDGGLVDDLLVYHCGSYYLLVVNASNKEKDLAWLLSHQNPGVYVQDISDATALLAVQGPKSREILQQLTDVPLDEIKYYHFRTGSLAGTEMLISRTGYTGEIGFELYFDAAGVDCGLLWSEIMDRGREAGLTAAGLGARDTLRLEMGFLLYGNDIDESTNPLEAGLGWITKLDKGDFIGREALLKAKQSGLSRKLVGLSILDQSSARKFIPRPGYSIHLNGAPVGKVTSGTLSPTLQTSIALGYVHDETAAEGNNVSISIRGNDIPFTIVKPPFLKR